MQKRHTDRATYFSELAFTSERYLIPYIKNFVDIDSCASVLEIGCGDGGNLLPFSRLGCRAVGVDISKNRIRDARAFFKESEAEGRFIYADIMAMEEEVGCFDLLLCHDVIEHISRKRELLAGIGRFMKPGGYLFIAFPAWQMPFGGHQQICRSLVLSKLPFIHLLPAALYKRLLSAFGESRECVDELMSIRESRMDISRFERLADEAGYSIIDRRIYLINPHYQVKFGLKPRLLSKMISAIPLLRNFFATSCFYMLQKRPVC